MNSKKNTKKESNSYYVKDRVMVFLIENFDKLIYFSLTIIALLLTYILVIYKNKNIQVLYKSIDHLIPYAFLVLFSIIYFFILYFKERKINQNKISLSRFFTIIFFKPQLSESNFIHSSIILTLFTTGITYIVSIAYVLHFITGDNKPIETINDIFTGGYIVALMVSLFIGFYGLYFAVIISKKQFYEIFGFERFLNELTEELNSIYIKSAKNNRIYRIYIVDFMPFIGLKSIGRVDAYNRYIEILNKIIWDPNGYVEIICHTPNRIEKQFQNIIVSYQQNLNFKEMTIKDSISEINLNETVNIWYNDEIGPHHFVIIDNVIAYEYLVVPFNENQSINQLIATKTYDQAKIDYLKRTSKDIISNAITPINHDTTNDCIVLSKNEKVYFKINDTIKIDDKLNKYIRTKVTQSYIKGISLRFQFEDEDGRVINYKTGYYPNKEEYFPLNDDLYLQLIPSDDNNQITLTVNTKNGVQKLFYFDSAINGKLFLENRTVDKEIIKGIHIKLKLYKECSNDAFNSTEYSHKTKIKLWD